MTEFGFMGVDWEERIDFGRLRRERLAKAKAALEASGAAALFVFRTEDARYLTGYRHHMNPVNSGTPLRRLRCERRPRGACGGAGRVTR